MAEKKPGSFSRKWLIIGLLWLSVYAGSYYAMVEVKVNLGPWFSSQKHIYAGYRFGGVVAVAFYYPWHVIDRAIRPGVWG